MIKAYACYNKDEIERENSSSGGIFPLLARDVINNNGIVYAACYDEKLEVIHKRISDLDSIYYAQGSKYVSSRVSDAYRQVIMDLENGRAVLFVGTPCQCAGLDSFLKYLGKDRKQVILVDFVCHGVPSHIPWDSYKKSFSSKNGTLVSVNMRDKSSGWKNGNYSWKEVTDKGKVIVTPRKESPYLKGMIANLFLRPSCYECRSKE